MRSYLGLVRDPVLFSRIPVNIHRTTMQISISARRVLMILCAAGLLTMAACDSGGDPPDEVVGVFDFTQLRFDPAPDFAPAINVLDTLEAAQIEFFSDGEFSFRYEFVEGSPKSVQGTYSREGDAIVLDGEEGDDELFRAVLLPASFRLDIQGGEEISQLTAAIETEFSGGALSEFNPEYEGISSVEGETLVTLERSF